MNRFKWVAYFLTLFALSVIASGVIDLLRNPLSEVFAKENGEQKSNQENNVPDWLFEDVKSRIPDTAKPLLKKEMLTFVQVHMKPRTADSDPKPEVAVYVTLDHLNGLFVLYEKQEGVYVAVYERQEPVYGLQVVGGGTQQLVLTSGFGGTGVQENKMYVIRSTPDGYKEVWDGIAHSHFAKETIEAVDGNIQFDGEDKLIYFELKRTMDSAGVTLMENSAYQLFVYNEKSKRFEK